MSFPLISDSSATFSLQAFSQAGITDLEFRNGDNVYLVYFRACSDASAHLLFQLSTWHQCHTQLRGEPQFHQMNRAFAQTMRLEKEDIESYDIICSPLFHEQAVRFAHYFAKNLCGDTWPEFDNATVSKFIHAHTKDGKKFPMPKTSKPIVHINSRLALSEKFRELLSSTENNDMAIWSFVWRIGREIIYVTKPDFCKKIDEDYNVIKSMRCHEELSQIAEETTEGCFGNMQLPDKKGLLNCLETNYIIDTLCRLHKGKRNQYLHDCFLKSEPYISGASGMMNSFSAMFELIGIDIDSKSGKELYHSLQAFIVCTAMHSKFEVETSYQRARVMYHKLRDQD
ncbi:hypothetical protein D5R81_18930 [Parashewanella spongiae]|uniref:Uncharacterized protein n=1 Tax=Parashewanella spongiae TaxID=342950 RepID=A0A3A6T1N3_9GAMM|nr:hypothetical protein [Parashewanella spongiae]MCL1080110.1 hypothetical protein [Parashewanella spongiae]RJY04926.1 hypothetical protein D5R81_18930 [Parashewanella spongiae]